MSNLYIVTVATHNEFYFPYLVKSCKRFGYELIVLGYGQKWLGYNWKFKLMINFLKLINKDDIVCFVDGYDVICNRDLNELKEQFIKFKKENNNIKIIVSHNKFTFKTMLVGEFSKITMNNYEDNLINTGSYIGYTSDLLLILEEIYNFNSNDDDDDQYLFTQYYKSHKELVYIDVEYDYFIVLHKYLLNIDKYFEINNQIAYYKNKQPFFIHAPGYTNLNKLIKKLGYDLSDEDDHKIMTKMKNNYLKKVIYYCILLIKKYFIFFVILYTIIIYYYFNKKI
jgi:hypothetical protein